MTKYQILKLKQPHIGNLIRAIREELDLTQEQLAGELGVTFPTVNRWENGHNQPSPMALKQIQIKLQELDKLGEEILTKHL
jgi:putative transcriptional regulator